MLSYGVTKSSVATEKRVLANTRSQLHHDYIEFRNRLEVGRKMVVSKKDIKIHLRSDFKNIVGSL